MSCILGENRDIFFPKMSAALQLTRFSDIATRYLAQLGYEAHECASEDEARARSHELIAKRRWPCYFFQSDTTGEKDFEEFYTDREDLDMGRFDGIGVIRNTAVFDDAKLAMFLSKIEEMQLARKWTRQHIIDVFNQMIPEFNHRETGKFLDGRM
jgi:hypothetical protein